MGCSVAMVCRVLGKPRSWLYYQRRSGRGRPLRRPELEESLRQLLGASPTSYGHRRIHALLKRRGVACNPKTAWRVRRRRGWLSTSRRRIIRSGRRHEGRVQVSEPNRRWASDITSIRAWDGQKGRLAILGERGPTHAESNASATMGRSTPRIGSAHWCEPWDSSRATRPDGVRSQTVWRRRSLAASSETMFISRVSKRWRRSASTLGVDRTLQSQGSAQRLGDAVASRVICGVVSQKQDSTCPTLGGAVHCS